MQSSGPNFFIVQVFTQSSGASFSVKALLEDWEIWEDAGAASFFFAHRAYAVQGKVRRSLWKLSMLSTCDLGAILRMRPLKQPALRAHSVPRCWCC